MKCELCHQQNAETVLYRPQDNGRQEELYVCKACAERESVFGETHGIQVAAMGVDLPEPPQDDRRSAETKAIEEMVNQLPPLDTPTDELLDKIEGLFGKFAEELTDANGNPIQDCCPNCGLKLEEIRSSGVIGCIECIEAFRKTICHLLEDLHGSTTYCGEPSVHFLRHERHKQLSANLKDAIDREDYLAAKEIKAELAALEYDEESSDDD